MLKEDVTEPENENRSFDNGPSCSQLLEPVDEYIEQQKQQKYNMIDIDKFRENDPIQSMDLNSQIKAISSTSQLETKMEMVEDDDLTDMIFEVSCSQFVEDN